MEKISFQATYTKISIYASASSGAPSGASSGASSGAKKACDKAGAGEIPDQAGACQRNKDGDTFTLSIEARSIRISGTLIVDDSGKAPSASGRNAKDAAGPLSIASDADGNSAGDGTDAAAIAAEYLEGLDLPSDVRMVNAFLDAMRKSGAQDGHGRHGRQPHFPQLGDPQDVADRIIGHLDREHAEKGGSRADLSDEMRRRLDDGAASASGAAMEYTEFRSETRMKIASGLDAWAANAPAG